MKRRWISMLVLTIVLTFMPRPARADFAPGLSYLGGPYESADQAAYESLTGNKWSDLSQAERIFFINATDDDAPFTDESGNAGRYARFRDTVQPTVMNDGTYMSTLSGIQLLNVAEAADLDVYLVRKYCQDNGLNQSPGEESGSQYDVTYSADTVLTKINGRDDLPSSVTVHITNASALSALNNYCADMYSIMYISNYNPTGTGNGSLGYFGVLTSDKPIEVTASDDGTNNPAYTVSFTTEGTLYKVSPSGTQTWSGNDSFTYSGSSFGKYNQGSSFSILIRGANYGNDVVGPVMPPADEIPDRPNDQAPEVNEPTVTQPSTNIVIGTDLTTVEQLLRAILLQLNDVDLQINELAQNVLEYLSAIFALQNEWFVQFNRWLEEIDNDLHKILQWLQQIYNKNSTPSPSNDDNGFWGWLLSLALAIIGNLPSALTQLTSAASGLNGVFPFSIPWDLAAMLTLLVKSPVTPVFDLPWAFGVGHTAMIHVDLSAWNGVMAAVRSVEKIIFAAGLAYKTRDLLKSTEVPE